MDAVKKALQESELELVCSKEVDDGAAAREIVEEMEEKVKKGGDLLEKVKKGSDLEEEEEEGGPDPKVLKKIKKKIKSFVRKLPALPRETEENTLHVVDVKLRIFRRMITYRLKRPNAYLVA
ncbi:hypothetical protein Tsubulata_030760, partial [Turnera subulata]